MRGLGRVELQRIFSQSPAVRIVAIEKPLAGVHRCFLVLHPGRHVDAVRDAMAVSNDEGRAIERFGLQKRFQGVLILCPHRDRRDVDVSVGHRHQSEIFLRAAFSAGGELRHCGARG